MRKAIAVMIGALASVVLTATPAQADNFDHGEFYKSDLSVACFRDKGEFPTEDGGYDGSTARWACWRVVNLKYVPMKGLEQVYRGKLGRLYGMSWGEADYLTTDGMPDKAKDKRIKYEATYFCYTDRWSNGQPKSRRYWSCFRDKGVVPGVLVWEKDELPKTCNDLTTWYIEGYRKNPSGPTRSTCRN